MPLITKLYRYIRYKDSHATQPPIIIIKDELTFIQNDKYIRLNKLLRHFNKISLPKSQDLECLQFKWVCYYRIITKYLFIQNINIHKFNKSSPVLLIHTSGRK